MPEQRLKQSAIGVKARGIKERIFSMKKLGEFGFKLFVDTLCTADEPHAGQAVAPRVQSFLRGRFHRRMLREAKVIVRAQVQHRLAVRDTDGSALRGHDHPLVLIRARLADGGQLVLEKFLKRRLHKSLNVAQASSPRAPEMLPELAGGDALLGFRFEAGHSSTCIPSSTTRFAGIR